MLDKILSRIQLGVLVSIWVGIWIVTLSYAFTVDDAVSGLSAVVCVALLTLAFTVTYLGNSFLQRRQN